MVNNNPFAPAQVNVAGGVNNLINQFRLQQALAKKQQLETARKQALSGLMQGGDPTEAVKKLMGIGDIEGASTLAKAVRTMQPTGGGLTAAQLLAHQDRVDALNAQNARAAETAKPQSLREYQAQFGGGEPQAAAPQPAADTTTEWKPTYDQYKLIQSGKMLPKPDATNAVTAITDQLARFKQNAISIRDNPNLKFAVGSSVGEVAPEGLTRTLFPQVQDTRNQIDTLLAQARNNILTLLKEQGGRAGTTGLGRVLLQEWQNFGNVVAPIQTSSSEPRFKQSMNEIIDYIDKANKRITDKYNQEYGGGTTSQPEPPTVSEPTAAPMPEGSPPGFNTISTAPPATATSPAADPRQMDWPQRTALARQLAQGGLNKQQITQWFAARGVTLPQ